MTMMAATKAMRPIRLLHETTTATARGNNENFIPNVRIELLMKRMECTAHHHRRWNGWNCKFFAIREWRSTLVGVVCASIMDYICTRLVHSPSSLDYLIKMQHTAENEAEQRQIKIQLNDNFFLFSFIVRIRRVCTVVVRKILRLLKCRFSTRVHQLCFGRRLNIN